jgi:hypothetical protein
MRSGWVLRISSSPQPNSGEANVRKSVHIGAEIAWHTIMLTVRVLIRKQNAVPALLRKQYL